MELCAKLCVQGHCHYDTGLDFLVTGKGNCNGTVYKDICGIGLGRNYMGVMVRCVHTFSLIVYIVKM